VLLRLISKKKSRSDHELPKDSHPYYTMIYCLSLSTNTEGKELKK